VLAEASDHQAHLVALECTIRAQLVLEHPIVSDDVGARRERNELPSIVPLQPAGPRTSSVWPHATADRVEQLERRWVPARAHV
jgi:hypothetical protein